MKIVLASLLVAAGLALPARLFPTDPPTPRPTLEGMKAKQTITPSLWFDQNAEEAIRFYVETFEDARVLSQVRWGPGGPVPEGTLMTARFQLAGREFMALNGGPMFHFNEAISLVVTCETQAEIDEKWERLTADGGEPGQCGWLKDRFGLSWQVVPARLEEWLGDPDPARAGRVGAALMQMKKLDLEQLRRAHDGA